jgi:carbonic anhydrase/acetyltransferase-like protein (isoleucine patch superfamily)
MNLRQLVRNSVLTISGYKGVGPRIARDCFIADTATIVGDIVLGEGSSVWFGASLRAELAPITIGKRCNMQDNCVLHTDSGFPTNIGDGVSIGHGAIVHGSTIGSNCLIGIGSIILNGGKIGSDCMVGAGALTTQGAEFPDGSLILGSPARVKRRLTEQEMKKITENAAHYFDFRAGYLSKMSGKTGD